MTATGFCPPIIQLALSVVDLHRTEAWFVDGLGFLPSGGSIFMMSGPIAGPVQGLPRAASCAWWLVGRNSWFQLELFQFRRPISKLMPADFRPCDVGYTRMGVHVTDFDSTLANLARLGSEPLAPTQGQAGQRRVCVRNPDGVFVEVMEDDPLPQPPGTERDNCPVALRSVTLSTPNLEASVAYLTAFNGKGPEEVYLHKPEHEALWGLPGASCKRAVFRSGDVLVEVVQYLDPVGKPWPPGYRISDQGILNFCYGARSKEQHRAVYQRTLDFGAKPNCRPLYFDKGGIVYMNDNFGFSVEITCIPEGSRDVKYGFKPLPREQRPRHDKLQMTGKVAIAAPADRVWEILSDQDAMSQWIGFDTVRRTRDGTPDIDGYGSERFMQGKPGKVVEQITGVDAGRVIRYRVIEGGPIRFHNGEIRLRPTDGGCEVEWSIRCRSKFPLVGGLLRRVMQNMLDKMLREGLKPFAERAAAA
jgi:uncharacterized protein YndB with AHSA1/START domain